MGDGSHGRYSGQEKGAKEQMAKEKCKAIEVKSAGTQHRLRRPSAQKLLQEGRAPKRPEDPIAAMEFKPFGSTESGQLGMNCKTLCCQYCLKSCSPDVMDVAAQSSSIMYIVFAGSISINKKRITSNYSTISCRNSPHRQLKFAIGHNSSLIAILLIHVSAFNAHRPSGTYQSCQ